MTPARAPYHILRTRPLISRDILLEDLAGEAFLSLPLSLCSDGAVCCTQVLVPSKKVGGAKQKAELGTLTCDEPTLTPTFN